MRRSAYNYSPSSYSFGPGTPSTAIQVLIGVTVAAFFVQLIVPAVTDVLGLVPFLTLRRLWLWQPLTYMFLHGGVFHILFNMLAVWMFGTELERIWGTRRFVRFYLVTGVGAGVVTVVFSLLPLDVAQSLYRSNVIGASGAVYGLLLAYGMYFPDRPIYLYMLFPIPAKIFVVVMGLIAFYASLSNPGGGVANATHLGGLLVGYALLKTPTVRLSPAAEVKYRVTKWRIDRMKKKFDVYSGGRSGDGPPRIH